MPWDIKKSKVQGAKRPCVIKVEDNNLTGEFMDLDEIGGNSFEYLPMQVGIYRVMHNIAKGNRAVKGCYLCYKQNEEQNFFNRMRISDTTVRKMSKEQINDEEYINNLGREKSANYNTK